MSAEVVRQIQACMRVDRKFLEGIFFSPLETLRDYDLTTGELKEFVLLHFSWLLPGELAGMGCPGSPEALILMQHYGVKALVCLLEDALPEEVLAHYHLQQVHLPIADFSAPSLELVEQAIAAIDDFIARKVPVAVHCMYGLGRTGTILACYLVSKDFSAQEAIEMLRTTRPGSIETSAQEAVVYAYEQQRKQTRNP